MIAPTFSAETAKVIAALDDAFPPTNPAVLLAAARDAYLNGAKPRVVARLLTWTLYVMSQNSPYELTEAQRCAVWDLYVAPVLA